MYLNILKIVYYSYFNSIINDGLPFWGNSPHSIKIFRMQKNIIKIMLGCRKRVSCRNLFRKLNISPLASQYIFYLMLSVIKNKNQFIVNSEIYSINTRQHCNLHQPILNLTEYEEGIYCTGLRVYNSLTPYIKDTLDDPKNFELQLKQFLYLHSFHSF
jgi:hypothetical protein